MNRLLLFIIALTIVTPLYAQERSGAGPLGIPFILEETPREGYATPEEARQAQARRQTWFEKQVALISLAEKKSIFHEKSIANVYKKMSDQMVGNKHYTLQRFIEIAKQVEITGNRIGTYGEHIILQRDGSYIRYFNGRPTDIFNLRTKDNYGNIHTVNIMNISYSDTDEFVVNYDTTSAHLMEYIRLEYDPIGAINYLRFFDAEYESNIDDRPSAYTTTEGAVEETSELELSTPTDTESAKELYDKIVDLIIPAIETALASSYTVTTAFSNITYYTASQNTATATTAGGVYGERVGYDYTVTSTDAPGAPETGTVSNIQYYLFNRIYIDPLDELWWHAQNATLVNLNHDKEAKEASSHTVTTKLGITREIDFFDATYDSFNSLTSYRETHSIDGTEVASYFYHDIGRDSYGRQTSYTVEANTYGLGYKRDYSGITYDVLSRITGYTMDETIDGVTTHYVYWDMIYNNLWQLSDYFYSIDGVEHHRFNIIYDSHGLTTSLRDVSVHEGITTTIDRFYRYNSNGLMEGYTEFRLRQSDTIHEFYFVWVGNITYNSIYAITSFDRVTIKDTNATTTTDYSDRIQTILNALIFDGVTYTLSTIDLIALGFNDAKFTITTEKWRRMEYYAVGESVGASYFNFELDTFRGRHIHNSIATRTTTTASDAVSLTTF